MRAKRSLMWGIALLLLFSVAGTAMAEGGEDAKVVLSANKLLLTPGEEETLTATFFPESADDGSGSWSSHPAGVVKVDEGRVTALAEGAAIVVFSTKSGLSDSCAITVKAAEAPYPTKIWFEQTLVSLRAGQRHTVAYKVLPEDAEDKALTWHSADQSIATVSESGVITAIKAGNTEISAEARNGVRQALRVEVTETLEPTKGHIEIVVPEKVWKKGETCFVHRGDEVQLRAALSADWQDASLTWTSKQTKVAKITAEGLLVASSKGTGSSKITLTAKKNDKKISHTLTFQVVDTVKTLKLNKKKLDLYTGLTTRDYPPSAILKAATTPKGGSLTWSSSDPSVAKVSQTGKVTAVSEGEATITAQAMSGKQASCGVRVRELPSRFSVQRSVTLKVGRRLDLNRLVTLNGSVPDLRWKSSNPKVARVDRAGVAQGIKAGTVTIEVKTANGLTGYCKLKVITGD